MKNSREFTETKKETPGNAVWIQKYVENAEIFLKDIESKFREILSELPPYLERIDHIVKTIK